MNIQKQERKQRIDLCKKFMSSAKKVKKTQPQSQEENQLTAFSNEQKELHLHRSLSAPASIQKSNWNISQVIKHQEGDHTFRNILIFLLFTAIFVFTVDLYKEIHQQKHQLELQRKRCHQEYIQSQCENPVEAIKQSCHEWEICFKKEADMTIRATQIAGKLIGRIVTAFLKETNVWGAAFILIILVVFLCFILGHSRSTSVHQTTLKKS